MNQYDKTRRESHKVILKPFYSEDALIHFQEWIEKANRSSLGKSDQSKLHLGKDEELDS